MHTFFEGLGDLIHRRISLQSVEICHYLAEDIPILQGATALLRHRRHLPEHQSVAHAYLHLRTYEGMDGWAGPLSRWSSTSLAAFTEIVDTLGSTTSIAESFDVLETLWPRFPEYCSAIDCALWDAACRGEGLPLFKALARETALHKASLPLYGSALGLGTQDRDVLMNVLADGYPLAKWTLDTDVPFDLQVSALDVLDVGRQHLALDAHGKLSVSQLRLVQALAAGFAWLEDPFSSTDVKKWGQANGRDSIDLPIVVGEDVGSLERLRDICCWNAVHAVNVEIERLGLTRSILLIQAQQDKLQTCYFHGRALLLACHLAVAFPAVIPWVEVHIAFVPERLATFHGMRSDANLHSIVKCWLEREGTGVIPNPAMRLGTIGIKTI